MELICSHGSHIWRDEHGNAKLWRELTAWIGINPRRWPFHHHMVVGPSSLSDGDAITLYRAKLRLNEAPHAETT